LTGIHFKFSFEVKIIRIPVPAREKTTGTAANVDVFFRFRVKVVGEITSFFRERFFGISYTLGYHGYCPFFKDR
jgi:hypothetical protein